MAGQSRVRQVGQCLSHLQPWMSDTEESPFLDPALRKRAVKVKHVKRREKKSEKKVMERVEWLWEGSGQGEEGEAQVRSWMGQEPEGGGIRGTRILG